MLAEVAPLQVRSTVFYSPTLRPEALSVIGPGAGVAVGVGVGVGKSQNLTVASFEQV
jgi:hypothetical protein